MKDLELGESYDAKELAEICGVDEDNRYGYYAFVGDKATVIAQDEGNDIVKVVEIIRLGEKDEYVRLKNDYLEIRVRCYQPTIHEWAKRVLMGGG